MSYGKDAGRFFEQFDTVLVRRKDTEIPALRIDQLTRVNDHADKASAFVCSSVVMLQTDPNACVCIPRTNMTAVLLVRIDPMLPAVVLFVIQPLLTPFPLGFAELHG